MYNLFSRFPVISYNGTVSNNILTRVQFRTEALLKGALFYPYTIKDGERADHIAANYYDDPRYAWVIWLANRIVDPYYDWPLDQDTFRRYIISKYGSIEKASNKIAYWQNNWPSDETILSPTQYGGLNATLKQYWDPIVGYNDRITGYQRKRSSDAIETNKTVELTVDSAIGFYLGERITQSTSNQLNAAAEIKMITNDTTIMVQHVVGTFANTGGSVGKIVGDDSLTETDLTDQTLIVQTVSDAQTQYISPVSFFDYEEMLNEKKRHIRVLDRAYLDQLEKELDALLE